MNELSEGIYTITAPLFEMRQWCAENLVGYWQVDGVRLAADDDGSEQALFISMMEEEDIILFKLRWLGQNKTRKAPTPAPPAFSLGDEDMMPPDFVITFPEDDVPPSQ